MAEENKQLFVELGSSGLKRWGGTLAEEWKAELRGAEGAKIYREMAEGDPLIGAVLRAIELLCARAEWRVEPAGADSAAREAAEFLESCLGDMSVSWHATLSEILSFLVYGWAFVEIVYKRRMGDHRDPSKRSKYSDGRIGWRKLALRAQDTLYEWVFDEEGGIQGMRQLAPPHYQVVTIPIEKGLLFRTKAVRGNPEGQSILRNAYRAWYFKRQLEAIEAVGIERDLAGLPVIWAPESVVRGDTDEDAALRARFLTLITNIRRDQQEGVVMPLSYDASGNKRYDLQLLTTGGRRQFDVDAVIQRYDARIAQSVLADFVLLGTQKVGTYSLATSKTRLFAMAIETYLDEVQEVMNAHAIPRLFRLNGLPTDRLPRLVHGKIEDVDLAELGEFIQKLAGAGAAIFPNEELERYLLELADLPVGEPGP